MQSFKSRVEIILGNIVLPPGQGVKTIIVPVTSDGVSLPIGVNGAIMEVAGKRYHNVLRQFARGKQDNLPEGTTVFGESL